MENGSVNAKSATSCFLVTDMKKMSRFLKSYGVVCALLLLATRIYGLFSHGVSSLSMELMFLPVLIGGIIFMWLDRFIPEKGKRLHLYTVYTYTFHTAIAFFVNGMLVSGILHIAGSESDKIIIFDGAATFFIAVTAIILIKIVRDMAR